MKQKLTCDECGGAVETYRLGYEFCSRCGGKRETYFIDDNERRDSEMSSAGTALSFVGILSGFVFAILLLLLKPELTGFAKAITYFSLISSLCILLFLCFFLLHTVRTLKNGYVHALHWFRDVINILYLPFGLMLVTLTFISWMAHWAYGVLCIVAAAAMFIFLRIKLGYEENIPKYMKRISKANQIHEQDVQMANQWIQFLEKNSLISKDQSTELTERLKNLQNKLSVEGNHT